MAFDVIILAAGKGSRMHSDLPKVLHPLAGRPLLAHVIDAARDIAPAAIHVVYGFGGDAVPRRFPDADLRWVQQQTQLGTGHAVREAFPGVTPNNTVLVLYGDVPLIRPESLSPLVKAAEGGALALLTLEFPDPSGYGRILRDGAGRVRAIVEHQDASAEERAVREINTGIMAMPGARLRQWLQQLENDNAQGEYYLTDVVAMAVRDGVPIETATPAYTWEVMGVNSKTQLAELERIAQSRRARELLEQGVTLLDPARIDIRGRLTCGRDVVIDINVVFEGNVELADGVHIGPNNVLRDVRIGANTQILPNCVIEQSEIGAECRVGPFARMRPGVRLADRARVGNFVELKASELGAGSKVNHLSYIGDTTVGRDANIGAGTITCNYDGANKHRTVIGDRAFIGSDTQLIAPVTVGADATIGAGSTITRDAPPGELTLSRAEQKTRFGWKRPVKKTK